METNMSARVLRAVRDALAKRAEQEGAEAGFTLIELMVVLLIMAILLAIAIPTFLGVKGGAQDRAAQSNLSNALISAKSSYATNSSYLTAPSLVAVLSSQEPELSFTTGAVSTSANNLLGPQRLGRQRYEDRQRSLAAGYAVHGMEIRHQQQLVLGGNRVAAHRYHLGHDLPGCCNEVTAIGPPSSAPHLVGTALVGTALVGTAPRRPQFE
jgi:prepilin-type N-terminal cleavage/methylation domain-containing protein